MPTIDQFSTRKMLPMVEELREPRTFFQSMLFRATEMSPTKIVDLDRDNRGLQVAQFTNPDATAKPTEKQSWSAHSFEIPYMKPMMSIQTSELVTRMPGETNYDERSMQERHRRLAARCLNDLDARIQRRIEVMASQVVRNGVITVTDEDGHTMGTVTFPRNSRTLVDLDGGDRWSESTADIVGDLEAMQDTSGELTGILPDFYFCSPEVWSVIRNNSKLLSLMDNVSIPAEFAKLTSEARDIGVRYGGNILGLPIYVVSTNYRIGTDTVRTVDSDTFGCASTRAGGYVVYGPIHEFDEAGNALVASSPRYPISWATRNPSVQNIQLHSAPLTMLPHWNSVQTWKVIGGS